MRAIAFAAAFATLMLAPAAYAQDDQIPPGLHPFSQGDPFTADDQQFVLDYHFITMGGGPEVAAQDKAAQAKLTRAVTLAMLNACSGPVNAYYTAKLAESKWIYAKYAPRIAKYQTLREVSNYGITAFRSPSTVSEMRAGLVYRRKQRADYLATPDNPDHPEWRYSTQSAIALIDLEVCAWTERARIAYGVTL